MEFDYATTTENLPYKIVGTSLVVNISGETDTQNSVLEEGILPLGSGTIQAQISLPEDMYKFTVEAIEGVGEWRIQSVKLVSYDNYLIAVMSYFSLWGVCYTEQSIIIKNITASFCCWEWEFWHRFRCLMISYNCSKSVFPCSLYTVF